jgi:hypothetical protein
MIMNCAATSSMTCIFEREPLYISHPSLAKVIKSSWGRSAGAASCVAKMPAGSRTRSVAALRGRRPKSREQ